MKKAEDASGYDYIAKLKPGLKGEMSINAGIYKGRYASRVEDVKNETVAFAHPLMKGVLLPVYRDLNFTFTLEDSAALYIYEFSVRRVEAQNGVHLLWADLDDEPKRVQRRQFLRIACFWNVTVFQVECEQKEPMTVTWRPAKALDISLRGTRFRMQKEIAGNLHFESGDDLMMRFGLFDKEYFQLGKATRIVQSETDWEVGMAFDSVPITIEKKLFEYIRQQEIMGRDSK